MDIAQLDDDSKMLGFYSSHPACSSTYRCGSAFHSKEEPQNVNLVYVPHGRGDPRQAQGHGARMDPGTAGQGPGLEAAGCPMANACSRPALHGGGRRAHCRRVAVRGPAGGRRGCVKFPLKEEGARGSSYHPLGKNDGSAGTVRYFTRAENHGTFAKPTNVACGDLPTSSTIG